MGQPGYFPDHAAERRKEFLATSPSERLAEAISLCRTATRFAVAGGAAMTRLDADNILRALLARGVEFLVVGELAAAVHGYVHATEGIEIVPSPTAETTRRLDDALVGLGAQTDEGASLMTQYGRVDVAQPIPGIQSGFDELNANALFVDLEGVGTVKVAGYADIVRMKRAAGRPQDLIDLERLREARGEGEP